MNIRKIARRVLRGNVKSTTRDYWEKSAKLDTKKTISRICDGYDEKTFATINKPVFFKNKQILQQHMVVLDLACGMGRTCKWVASQVSRYVGVDFIPDMIEKAKQYNSDVTNKEFFVNDGKTLQIFDNETFDIVYCELAFQHMEKQIQKSYVPEILRVLKTSGVFYCQLPKLSFYNDQSFALTRSEVDSLFAQFCLNYIDEGPAYFIIAAKKPA